MLRSEASRGPAKDAGFARVTVALCQKTDTQEQRPACSAIIRDGGDRQNRFDHIAALSGAPTRPAVPFNPNADRIHWTCPALSTSCGDRVRPARFGSVEYGIDDWVAGVHLQSDVGRVWCHEDGQLVRRG
jgi:hypothetical protein